MPWLGDIGGIRRIVDATGATPVLIPQRDTLRVEGSAVIIDDGEQTILTVGGGSGGGGSAAPVGATTPGIVPAYGAPGVGKVPTFDLSGEVVWEVLTGSVILNSSESLRGATVTDIIEREAFLRLPVPEDFVPFNISLASVDEDEEWEIYIHEMLATFSTCAMTKDKVYLISGGELAFNSNNTLYMNGATVKKKDDCDPNADACYAQSLTNLTIIGPGTFDGNNTGDGLDSTHGHVFYMENVDGFLARDIRWIEPSLADAEHSVGALTGHGYLRNALFENCEWTQTVGTEEGSPGAAGFGWFGTMSNVVFNRPKSQAQGFKTAFSIDGSGCEDVVMNCPRIRDANVHGILIGYSATNTRFGVTINRPFISNSRWNAIYLQGEGNWGVEIYNVDLEFNGGGAESALASSSILSFHKSCKIIGGEIRDTGKIKGGGTRGTAQPLSIYKANGTVIADITCKRTSWAAFYFENTVEMQVRNVKWEEIAVGYNGTVYQAEGTFHGTILFDGCSSSTEIVVGAYHADAGINLVFKDSHLLGPDVLSGTAGTTNALTIGIVNSALVYDNEVSGWNGTGGGAFSLANSFDKLHDGTVRFFNNRGARNTARLRLVAVPDGDSWLFTEEDALQATTALVITGAGDDRHRYIKQWLPRKVVYADSAPATGANTWAYGDTILPRTAELSSSEVSRHCTVAGDAGTWRRLVSEAIP